MKIFLRVNPNSPFNLMTRYPAYNDRTRTPGLTDDEFLEVAILRELEVNGLPSDTTIYRVDSEDLPDDYFFNAWTWSD